MDGLLARTSAIVVASISGMLLAVTALERLPGSRWPYVWLGLDVVLIVGRLAIIERTRASLTRGELAPLRRYTIIATVWCLLLGVGAGVCVRTADAVLVVLAAITIAGVAAGISTLSAAFPRLATFQILLVGLPCAISAALSPAPWSGILAIDIVMLLAVMSSLTRMHHRDRIDLIRAERANWYLASHDVLTGLANRKSLFDQLERLCVRQSTNSDAGSFAVLCLDLDGFKAVNDTFGHPVGDTLLVAVAQRLKNEVREPDVVARMGGDEFIILLQHVDDAGAASIAGRIIDAICCPIALGLPSEVTISVTIGSAFAPQDAQGPDQLLARADQALYAAKRTQRGAYRTYAGMSRPAPGPAMASEPR